MLFNISIIYIKNLLELKKLETNLLLLKFTEHLSRDHMFSGKNVTFLSRN